MKLEIDQNQLNIIIGGLQEIAHKYAAPVLAHIDRQVKAHNEAMQAKQLPSTSSVDFEGGTRAE